MCFELLWVVLHCFRLFSIVCDRFSSFELFLDIRVILSCFVLFEEVSH